MNKQQWLLGLSIVSGALMGAIGIAQLMAVQTMGAQLSVFEGQLREAASSVSEAGSVPEASRAIVGLDRQWQSLLSEASIASWPAWLAVLALGFAVLSLWLRGRARAEGQSALAHALRDLADGRSPDQLLEASTQWPEPLGHSLQQLAARLQQEDTERGTREHLAQRALAALEAAPAGLLIADGEGRLQWMNRAAEALWPRLELGRSRVDRDLPVALDAPSGQTQSIDVGEQRYQLSAEHLSSAEGAAIGRCVWVQMTPRRAPCGLHWQPLHEACERGDFSQRLPEDEHSEAREVNRLLGAVEGALEGLQAWMASLQQGDDQRAQALDHLPPRLREPGRALLEHLGQFVQQIDTGVHGVQRAAEGIAEANEQLHRRAEQQVAGLSTTSARVLEITSTITRNADHARQARLMAQSARTAAEGGGEVVNNAIGAMRAINESSKKISEIISVIDEIAFQTNLLALNASVEAARAGEQGRGFAVVAGEVGNLAGRSATAAKEIKHLIEDSVQRVSEGSQLVNDSGSKLNEIVRSVNQMSDVIQKITEASETQAAGIQEVNQSVTQVDQATQQNALLVSHVHQAHGSLQTHVEGLGQALQSFAALGTDVSARVEDPRPAPRRRQSSAEPSHLVRAQQVAEALAAKHPRVHLHGQDQQRQSAPTARTADGGLAEDHWDEF